jgi:NMD protein affecting ribosome stability and mRNA decay
MACLSPATSPRQAVLDNVPLASVAENAHECVGCGGIDNLSVLGPCEHHVCRRCIVSSLPEDGASPQNVSIAICPACKGESVPSDSSWRP